MEYQELFSVYGKLLTYEPSDHSSYDVATFDQSETLLIYGQILYTKICHHVVWISLNFANFLGHPVAYDIDCFTFFVSVSPFLADI